MKEENIYEHYQLLIADNGSGFSRIDKLIFRKDRQNTNQHASKKAE
jgi:hypothetical protein